MSDRNSAVGIFDSHSQTEAAVKELQRSGFDISKQSIVGRDYHSDEAVVGVANGRERMSSWEKRGAFWGGRLGMLFGSAFFWVPGLGSLLVAGPLVTIIGADQGADVVGGLSALGAALCSMGIPRDGAIKYETAIKTGRFVLILPGTPEEVEKAAETLDRAQASETHLHVETLA